MEVDIYVRFVYVLIILLTVAICIILILIIVKCIQTCIQNRLLCCKPNRRQTRQRSVNSNLDCFSNEFSSDSSSSNSEFEDDDIPTTNLDNDDRFVQDSNAYDNLAFLNDNFVNTSINIINRKFNDPSRLITPNKSAIASQNGHAIFNELNSKKSCLILDPSSLCKLMKRESQVNACNNIDNVSIISGQEDCIFNMNFQNANDSLRDEIKSKIDIENDEIPPSYEQVIGENNV
ncbi:unnamed protein product [Brachionus calyciflorus]|uniref:Uncharacterized protein n=1 Tax=Brachionus calyciflorus TaxID=104777 RepID=A0A814CJT6_9BILA|nr:unnamed protein product [Brachionus calyciflorus]